MLKLYFLSGSLHSQRALDILKGRRIKFRRINASESNVQAELFKLNGIRQLPTLTNGTKKYEGLDQIIDFLEISKSTSGSVVPSSSQNTSSDSQSKDTSTADQSNSNTSSD
jgi:hypothetical protein